MYKPVIFYCFTGRNKEDDMDRILFQESGKNGNSTLKINPVTFDDEGIYECYADNGIGSGLKTNFSIIVRGMN